MPRTLYLAHNSPEKLTEAIGGKLPPSGQRLYFTLEDGSSYVMTVIQPNEGGYTVGVNDSTGKTVRLDAINFCLIEED